MPLVYRGFITSYIGGTGGLYTHTFLYHTLCSAIVEGRSTEVLHFLLSAYTEVYTCIHIYIYTYNFTCIHMYTHTHLFLCRAFKPREPNKA